MRRISAVVVGVLLLSAACQAGEPRFAIYLVKDETTFTKLKTFPPVAMLIKKEVLQEPPLLTETDIVRYERKTHVITLTSQAGERIQALWTRGARTVPFLLAVDGEPAYDGVVVSLYSSSSYSRPALIPVWPSPGGEPLMKIGRRYPDTDERTLRDPRNSRRVMSVLRQLGKLSD